MLHDFLFGALFIVCHGRFFLLGRILHARSLLYVMACRDLVRTTLHFRRKNYLHY